MPHHSWCRRLRLAPIELRASTFEPLPLRYTAIDMLSALRSALFIALIVALATACGGSSSDVASTAIPTPVTTEADAVPGARDRVVVRGTITLDGSPVDSRFLGAIVVRDGLVTPCQYTLPSVDHGQYEITVLADAEGSGCGAPGAQIFLWTNALDQNLYTRESVVWPGNGGTANFDATVSASAPGGGAPAVSEFFGDAFNRNGERLPGGTRVEAYVGDVRCAVASTRYTGSFTGYILAVVGPDSIAGCDRGAALTFRIDGQPAAETSVNDVHRENSRDAFDLTLR